MKIFKKFRFLVDGVIAISIVYLFFAGVNWNWMIPEWTKWTRGLFLIIECFLLFQLILDIKEG